MAKAAKRVESKGDDAKRDQDGSGKGRPGSGTSRRYTPPTATVKHGPSPRWVPITMFTLWGAGLLVIILNYMQVLPGSSDGGNGWYLVVGLVAILAGIIVSTRYR